MAVKYVYTDLDVDGDVTSDAFVTDGGTSTQFVKGDGSLDSTTYIQVGNAVTAVTASAPLESTGGNTPNITHLNSNGYKHIPAGGTTEQWLKWSALGTASWEDLSTIGTNSPFELVISDATTTTAVENTNYTFSNSGGDFDITFPSSPTDGAYFDIYLHSINTFNITNTISGGEPTYADGMIIRVIFAGLGQYYVETLNDPAVTGSGTVTEVTSSTTGQLTVATGTTTPALSIVTAAIVNGGTALATGDQIYDWVTGLGYTSNIGDITGVNITAGTGLTGSVNTDSGQHTQTINLSAATTTVRGGIELESATVGNTANAITSTASRTYGLQVNAAGQGVINVPWTDTDNNTTYTASDGVFMDGTNVEMNILNLTNAADGVNVAGDSIVYYDLSLTRHVHALMSEVNLSVFKNDANWNNYSLPLATSTVRGGIELFSNTDNPTAANSITSTASRTYGLQLNSSNQGVINVPWVNTTYTSGNGLTGTTTFAVGAGNGISVDASNVNINYGTNGNNIIEAAATVNGPIPTGSPVTADSILVADNDNGALIHEVAFTDIDLSTMNNDQNWNNYSLPQATATTRGGVELFSNTDNPTAANAVTSTAARTYGIQLNSSNQMVVNVPWTTGGTMTSFTVAGDSGTNQTISNGNTLSILGGDGISTYGENTDVIGVAIDYLGANNFILESPLLTSPLGTDYIVYSDSTDSNVKHALISSLPFTNNTGTVTNVTVGTGLDVATGTTTPAITLDLNELPASGTLIGTDDIVVVNGTASQKEQIDQIPLGIFLNDQGWTDNAGIVESLTTTGTSGAATLISGVLNVPNYATGSGTVTSVTAGAGMTQTGTSTINPTLNVIAANGGAGNAAGGLTVLSNSMHIDYEETATNNVVMSAAVLNSPVSGDYILYHDSSGGRVVRADVSSLPYGSMSSWDIEVNGVFKEAVGNGENVNFVGGDGVKISGTTVANPDITFNLDYTSVNPWTGQQYFAADVDTTNSGTLTWDLDIQQVNILTLTGNCTLSAPDSGTQKAGATYILILKQDGTGSRTMTWNSIYKWAGGVDPTLSTGASDVDIFTFISDGTNMYGVGNKNFS